MKKSYIDGMTDGEVSCMHTRQPAELLGNLTLVLKNRIYAGLDIGCTDV